MRTHSPVINRRPEKKRCHHALPSRRPRPQLNERRSAALVGRPRSWGFGDEQPGGQARGERPGTLNHIAKRFDY
jgi:hypothetical protein